MPAFIKELGLESGLVAMTGPNSRLTWGEVDLLLNRCANAFLETDLGSSRRVAVFAENSCETALTHLAGLFGGVSTVPVNFHLKASEAAYILRDSCATVVFAGPETVGRAIEAAELAEVSTVVAWGDFEGPQVLSWNDWLGSGSDSSPPEDVRPLPNMLYTSGTTGLPKGTELPPTMFVGGSTVREHLDALKESGYAKLGTHLVLGPMYHTGPLSGMRSLLSGVPSVIMGRFDAEQTLRAISEHRAESTLMVPTHFIRLLDLPSKTRERYDVSSMQRVVHTGSKCPVEVKRAMIEWWGPIFLEAYGATEVGTTCSITSEEWLEHPGSVGRAIPPFTSLILDDEGNETPAGEEGRLFFRDSTGRGVVYPNDPEKSAAVHLEPGLFTLGEVGHVDNDGYVYIDDRVSDMVVSGGVNLYPAEAEQVLLAHPGVADVACIGIPHREMGEELKALVIPVDPGERLEEGELLSYCRERLSHHKSPRSVTMVQDLGRTSMGKIDKRKLRSPWWDEAVTD
jgi:long-chain acyl-CoA synthetase